MKTHFGAILLAAVLIGCGDQKSAPGPQAPPAAPSAPVSAGTESKGSNSGAAPGGYLGTVVNAQQSAMKKVDTVALNNAVDLFNAQEGRYPKDLDELVSKHYINALPPVPHGMKLQYDAVNGKVSVVDQ